MCARIARHSRRTSSNETELRVEQRVHSGPFGIPDFYRLMTAWLLPVLVSFSPELRPAALAAVLFELSRVAHESFAADSRR